MNRGERPARGRRAPAPRGRNLGRARLAAAGSLLVAAVLVVVILAGAGGSGSPSSTASTTATGSASTKHRPTAATTPSRAVPILTYHVINTQPPGSSLPAALYVPTATFQAQMQALKAAGWHAITLDQLVTYWAGKTRVPGGKAVVITFDDGYASQYANALPVLKSLGWAGVLNLQPTGLPASEGGISDTQVQGLIAAGWELGVEPNTQPDLTTLDPTTLSQDLTNDRQNLRSRFASATVNWFAYPAGRYNATVTAAVRSAGFTGAMTTVSGWASPRGDRFLLPRVPVTGGTTPSALLAQIAAAAHDPAPPVVSPGA